jgi:TIR domain
MPARVEYRLGSIFDEECDVLVIPSSVEGTVSISMAGELRNEGIPLPPPMSWGAVTLVASPSPYFGAVAYAATLSEQITTVEIIKGIGRRLGTVALTRQAKNINTPLLGAGEGELPVEVAADALESGFLEIAPDTSVLRISLRSQRGLQGLTTGVGTAPIDTMALMKRKPFAGPAAITDTIDNAWPLFVYKPTASPSEQFPQTNASPKRTRVFVSYSHADAEWLTRLQKHLRPLEREGALIWADTRIKAGAQWREEIRAALAETKVAVLLVSADFMASEFIVTNELPPLLEAAEKEGATILPVIISASAFGRTPSLSRFQAINNPEKPLVQMRRGNREKVLDDVARAVEDALKQ